MSEFSASDGSKILKGIDRIAKRVMLWGGAVGVLVAFAAKALPYARIVSAGLLLAGALTITLHPRLNARFLGRAYAAPICAGFFVACLSASILMVVELELRHASAVTGILERLTGTLAGGHEVKDVVVASQSALLQDEQVLYSLVLLALASLVWCQAMLLSLYHFIVRALRTVLVSAEVPDKDS